MNIQNYFELKSKVTITFSGVKMAEESIKIKNTIYPEFISQVSYKNEKDSLIIEATITGKDKNGNALIAENFAEFCKMTFSLFSSKIRLTKIEIDPRPDYRVAEIEVGIPVTAINQAKAELILSDLINIYNKQTESTKVFFTLLEQFSESQQDMSYLHRFRSIFAVFEALVKDLFEMKDFINYQNEELKDIFIEVINEQYSDQYYSRLLEILKGFIEGELIDERANVNYSNKLKESMEYVKQEKLISKDVAFNTMKCIQQVRNRLNHGDFLALNYKQITGAYELLLPMVKKLIVLKSKELLNE